MQSKINLYKLILILSFPLLMAFTPESDSLLSRYKKETQPPKKLQYLLHFCAAFKTYPVDTLKKYATEAVSLSLSQKDNASIADAYTYLARAFLNLNNLDSAIWACDKIDKYALNTNKPSLAKNKADLMRGTIFTRKGQHDKAIAWFYKILPRVENEKDSFNYLGILNGIGLSNLELKRYNEAKRWFLKVIQFDAPQFEKNKSSSYLNLASSYGGLQQYDSAAFYIQHAIALADKYNLLAAKANSLNIWGDVLMQQEQFEQAIEKIQQSIKIRKQIGDPYYTVSDMAQLSHLYKLQGNFAKGITLAEEALQIAVSHQMIAKYPMIYQSLYENYYGAGNYKKSADLMQKLLTIQDSLNNAASAKSLAEMDVKYETAKREEQIKDQRYAIRRKNLLLIVSAIIIALIGVLAYVLYNRYKLKQKSKLQQAIIKEQDEAAKAVIAAEENERSRMSQTLHDGLGQLLSAAKMNLQALTNEGNSDEKNVSIYTNAVSLLDQSIAEMRNVSHQMVTNNVIRKGLANALKELIEKIDSNQLKVTLDATGLLQNINPDIQLIVYRILQESINNVIKHANANKLDIWLNVNNDMLKASVKDNGKGFDTGNARTQAGIGLDNIETRIKFLKGFYSIESTKESGTTLHFEIPL